LLGGLEIGDPRIRGVLTRASRDHHVGGGDVTPISRTPQTL